jgi:hypothetical protein
MPLDTLIVIHIYFLMWRNVQFKGLVCFKLVLRILDLGPLLKMVLNLQAIKCMQLGFLVFCDQIVFLEVNFELKLSCEFTCVLQFEISIEKGKIQDPFPHVNLHWQHLSEWTSHDIFTQTLFMHNKVFVVSYT